MDADQTQESSQPGDVGELPTPSFSGSGDSSTSESDAIVSKLRSALLEELKPVIQQTIEKQVQSTKDKRIAKIEGRLGMLAELEEQGATIPENLKQEMRFRDLEERLTRPAQPAQSPDDGSSGQKQAVADAIAELNKYNLPSNDPAFFEILKGNYPQGRSQFDLKVMDYILEKLSPPKPANPADIVQSPVTAGAEGKNPEALISNYQKEMLAARGNASQVRAIKDKFIKLGVPVDQVVFT